jgi:hypothetical protein
VLQEIFVSGIPGAQQFAPTLREALQGEATLRRFEKLIHWGIHMLAGNARATGPCRRRHYAIFAFVQRKGDERKARKGDGSIYSDGSYKADVAPE